MSKSTRVCLVGHSGLYLLSQCLETEAGGSRKVLVSHIVSSRPIRDTQLRPCLGGGGQGEVPISISEDDEAGVPSGLFFKYRLFNSAVLDRET